MKLLRKAKRLLDPVARIVLPSTVYRRVALRLAGHGPIPRKDRGRVAISERTDGFLLSIDNAAPLALSREMRRRIDYQFFRNRDCFYEAVAFARFARAGKVLYDVGAADGIFSLLFLNASPANRAVAYEPSPHLRPVIQSQVSSNGFNDRFLLRPVAAAATPTRLSMMRAPLDYYVVEPGGKPESLPVEAVSLDQEWMSGTAPAPDMIKIDVEGFEFDVLTGAERTLREWKPALFVELHLNFLESGGKDPSDLLSRLCEQGYRFYSHRTGSELTAARIATSVQSGFRFLAVHRDRSFDVK